MSKRRSGLANDRRAYHICCAPKQCSPGTITGLIGYNYYPIDISWNALPGATSYTVTTTKTSSKQAAAAQKTHIAPYRPI